MIHLRFNRYLWWCDAILCLTFKIAKYLETRGSDDKSMKKQMNSCLEVK